MRLLRWIFVCQVGRRCADVRLVDAQVPPGFAVFIRYRCEGCGTEYVWDGGRRRARPDDDDREVVASSPPVDIAPGERGYFEGEVPQ